MSDDEQVQQDSDQEDSQESNQKSFFADVTNDQVMFSNFVKPKATFKSKARIQELKNKFEQTMRYMPWYKKCMSFQKNMYKLQEMATDANTFFSNLSYFYTFSCNGIESFPTMVRTAMQGHHEKFTNAEATPSETAPKPTKTRAQRFWKQSNPDSKSNKRFEKKMSRSRMTFDDEEHDEPVENDEQEKQPQSKKRKREQNLDLEFTHSADQSNSQMKPTKKRKLVQALQQMQEEQALIAVMEPSDAAEHVQTKKLDTALLKASGKRDKDNAKFLKSKIKNDKSKKKKSKKEWEERNAKVENDMQQRADKRAENLKNKKTRGNQAQQKTRKARPGFEGKRRKPINGAGKMKKARASASAKK